jgi:tetratricopeptide (TPR) repeat protein
VNALRATGGDIGADAVEVVDGTTGRVLASAGVPSVVKAAPVRLFERMYLPGPGVVAMRTALARQLGYDTTLTTCEDTDILLRAIASGARLAFVDHVGYRLFAYADSLSRNVARQRRLYAHVLAKHAYEDVEAHYRRSHVPDAITAWALVSIAMYRADYVAVDAFVARAAALAMSRVDERAPAGVWPVSTRWCIRFFRGTAHALAGRTGEALRDLREACAIEDRPEALNNLGVVLARVGRVIDARAAFERAAALAPTYVDARVNMATRLADRITTHPLRTAPARQDYPRVPPGDRF